MFNNDDKKERFEYCVVGIKYCLKVISTNYFKKLKVKDKLIVIIFLTAVNLKIPFCVLLNIKTSVFFKNKYKVF